MCVSLYLPLSPLSFVTFFYITPSLLLSPLSFSLTIRRVIIPLPHSPSLPLGLWLPYVTPLLSPLLLFSSSSFFSLCLSRLLSLLLLFPPFISSLLDYLLLSSFFSSSILTSLYFSPFVSSSFPVSLLFFHNYLFFPFSFAFFLCFFSLFSPFLFSSLIYFSLSCFLFIFSPCLFPLFSLVISTSLFDYHLFSPHFDLLFSPRSSSISWYSSASVIERCSNNLYISHFLSHLLPLDCNFSFSL